MCTCILCQHEVVWRDRAEIFILHGPFDTPSSPGCSRTGSELPRLSLRESGPRRLQQREKVVPPRSVRPVCQHRFYVIHYVGNLESGDEQAQNILFSQANFGRRFLQSFYRYEDGNSAFALHKFTVLSLLVQIEGAVRKHRALPRPKAAHLPRCSPETWLVTAPPAPCSESSEQDRTLFAANL